MCVCGYVERHEFFVVLLHAHERENGANRTTGQEHTGDVGEVMGRRIEEERTDEHMRGRRRA